MAPRKRSRAVKATKETSSGGSHAPSWKYRAESRVLTERLISLHGKPERTADPLNEYNITQGHHQSTVLDSLVRTILSQNTTDKTSIRAFASLKETFPDWNAVRTADVSEVAESIRVGGLADAKASWIQTILDTLHEERGACSLEWLRDLPTNEIKDYLLAFKGVGPKTVSCTLLFALERADFPVDTHVNRISADLGWVGKNSSREATYEHLNAVLEDDIKYDLHITLVEHGKTCSYCSTRRGSIPVEACPVRELKAARRKAETGDTSGKRVRVGRDVEGVAVKDEGGDGVVKCEDEVWVKTEEACGEAV